VCHELIGLQATVADHTDPTLRGRSGRVVDESMNTIVIEESSLEEVRVPKLGAILIFKLPSGLAVKIRGDALIGRPEDRIKRCRR